MLSMAPGLHSLVGKPLRVYTCAQESLKQAWPELSCAVNAKTHKGFYSCNDIEILYNIYFMIK